MVMSFTHYKLQGDSMLDYAAIEDENDDLELPIKVVINEDDVLEDEDEDDDDDDDFDDDEDDVTDGPEDEPEK